MGKSGTLGFFWSMKYLFIQFARRYSKRWAMVPMKLLINPNVLQSQPYFSSQCERPSPYVRLTRNLCRSFSCANARTPVASSVRSLYLTILTGVRSPIGRYADNSRHTFVGFTSRNHRLRGRVSCIGSLGQHGLYQLCFCMLATSSCNVCRFTPPRHKTCP